MVDLGRELYRPSSVPEDLRPPAPDPSVMLLLEIRNYLAQLPELIASLPQPEPQLPPTVILPEPDLTDIVNAVNGMKPGATPDEIGRAIARHLNPPPLNQDTGMLEAFRELVEKIDFRLQGVGRAFGSSGPSNISDNAQRQLGVVSITGPLPALPLSANPLTGQTTIATGGTAVQLPNEVLVNGLIVQALAANVGKVYVGASGVTSGTGFELQAGQAASAGIQNANSMWVVGANIGDGVCFIGS